MMSRRVLLVAAGTAITAKCLLQERSPKQTLTESRWSGWERRAYAQQSNDSGVRKYPFVVLGSGTAAHAALETLRLNNPNADILLISASEGTLPRMDKTSLSDSTSDTAPRLPNLAHRLRDIYDEWRRPLSDSLGEFSEQVSLICASKVKIDVEDRMITLNDRRIHYEKCLLASAGRPREFYVLDRDKFGFSGANENINTLHTLLDFHTLENFVASTPPDKKKHVTIVGGGYLGTEIVASLAESGRVRVTHLMGERTPLAQYLPQYLSEHVGKKLTSLGVDVRGEALLTGLKPGVARTTAAAPAQEECSVPNQNTLALPMLKRTKSRILPTVEEGITLYLVGANQVNLETDYLVLASTNVQPDLMGLDDASVGLEVSDGGIVTNASLEAYDGLFVAGNAATYYDTSIGRRRVDTYDHAVASGMWAAHNMLATDRLEQYTHQPIFKSSLPGTGLSFVGLGKIDAKLETVGVWFLPGYEGSSPENGKPSTDDLAIKSQSFRRGLIYYLERGRVVGVLLCNAPEMLERARDVLRAKKAVTDPVNELPKCILLAPQHWLHVISTK